MMDVWSDVLCVLIWFFFMAVVGLVVFGGDGPRECHLEDAQRRNDALRLVAVGSVFLGAVLAE